MVVENLDEDEINENNDIDNNCRENESLSDNDESVYNDNLIMPYSNFRKFQKAHREFENKFTNNPYGHACSVCDRLWFLNDLRLASILHENILNSIIPNIPRKNIELCNTCRASLNKNKIPTIATHNGFKYPTMPDYLPLLNLVSERLISPRLPFMHIRRLRHVNGQYGIYGQIINIPVSIDTMIKTLPRHLDDDHCINVHIKRKMTHKSSYLLRNVK